MKKLVLSVILVLMISGPLGLLVQNLYQIDDTNQVIGDESSLVNPIGNQIEESHNFVTADAGAATGIIDPILIEQAGYVVSDNLSARTDTQTNTEYNLTMDEGNNWIGSVAEVDVWNLQRQYAVNGSFDEGVPGKNANPGTTSYYPYGWTSSSSGSENQYSSYVQQAENYITVENQGEPGGLFSDYFDHYTSSYVVWYQTIDNSPASTQFIVSFDYLYLTGPIYNAGGDDPGGYASIIISIDGTIEWSLNLLNLDERNLWYNTGDIVLNLPSVGSSFTFAIGIYVYDGMRLYPDRDYDNDGSEDGAANTGTILVHFDDISLTSTTAPDPNQVDLTFEAGSFSQAIIGSEGTGNATITNPSLWTTNPLLSRVTSNTSVTFDYRVKLLSHRFINSTWTTDTTKEGVSYSVNPNNSPSLKLYAYVGIVDPYQDFYVNIIHPSDWENITVFDPFQNDVSGQIIFSPGMCTIPTELVTRLGWWEINLVAPNYAQQFLVQEYEEISETWSLQTVYRPDDILRAQVDIGTSTNTPTISNPIEFQWLLPNDTLWSSDIISSSMYSLVNSTARTIGGFNTTAGEWTSTAFWTNGTEIAYSSRTFDVYHSASIQLVSPEQSVIETTYGLTISNLLYFIDAENGQYLLDNSVSITANWSSTTVIFTPNFVKNWWEGDFDTNDIEGGEYLVIVNVSRPYYDDTSLNFTVISIYESSLEILNIGDVPVQRGLGEDFPVDFQYKRGDGSGIPGATVEVSYSSTFHGLERNTLFDYGNGTYTLHLSANTSDTYSIIISTSKLYHENSSDSFTIIVENIATDIIRLNGTSDAIKFGETYLLAIQYKNSSGIGLSGASSEIVGVTPDVGLENSCFTEFPDGIYVVTLIPTEADVFTIVLRFSLTNHETQFTTFTLTVSEIPTTLSTEQSSFSIAYDQNYTVNLQLKDDNLIDLANATIEIVNLPTGLEYTSFTDWLNGTYSITLTPGEIGTYDLLFRSYLKNYQNSTETISLLVTLIPTEMYFIDSLELNYLDSYDLLVFFNRSDLNLPISGANITISEYPSEFVFTNVMVFPSYYVVHLKALQIGINTITISASLNGYRYAEAFLTLEIVNIQTEIEGSNPAGTLTYGRPFLLNFSYLMELNQTGITEANITAFGESAGWVTINSLGLGDYSITLIPQEIGTHEVSLVFEKYGFQSKSFRVTFTVGPVPIRVIFISGMTGLEESEIQFVIQLREVDTGTPVSNAFVRYLISDSRGTTSDFITMTESIDEPGQYSAPLVMPANGGSYSIQIFLELDNFEMTGASSTELTPETNLSLLVIRTVRDNALVFLILGTVFIGLIARQVLKKREIRENIEALAVKKRFDDLRNILGVIVLHKESGLPLYSKIIRAGVDESIIAAFITAIRNFREEFDIENGLDETKIVPISDIIRIITTENLVIAFITLQSPSSNQRMNMLTYAQKVSMVFDTEFKSAPMEVIDSSTAQSLDTLFDEILDGMLALNYKLTEDEKLTKASECFTAKIEDLPGEVFKLDNLAMALATCGIEEAKAYKMIMDAVEKDVIVLTDEKITTPEEIFIAEVESLLVAEEDMPEDSEDE